MMPALTNRQGFAPATLGEAMQFSEMLAASSMVPRAYQGKAQDILVCVQWGYEIGLAPMQALQNIAVINGKPSVYGDAAMALVQASPVCEDIEEYIENEGTPNPIAVCVAKRKGRKPVMAKFSVEDAKRAGLWGKQGPWQAYPKRMMQMRARGFALRDAFPDVLKGLITVEEAQDYPDEAKPRQAKDITPRNPLDAVAPPALEAAETELVEVVDPVTEETVAAEEAGSPEPDRVPGEDDDLGEEPAVPVGYALLVPGKTEPVSTHDTLDQWADAYEEMAEKVAKAGKRTQRERMTALRELKEANTRTLNRVDTVKRIRHTANYSKRLAALGASQ